MIGHVGEMLDVEWVASSEVTAQLLDVRGDGLVAVGLGVALTPAVDAAISLDLDEKPVLAEAGID